MQLQPSTSWAPGQGNSRLLCVLLTLTVLADNAFGADPFDEMVRSTPWLSPSDALRSFVVPEGFEMQLVASEPEIGKPISMCFDVSGRLWVAETRTYPIETATNRTPRDSVRILSRFGEDGRAQRNEVVADNLVMPDAVAPFKSGAIVFSIPNIVSLQDSDGDGKADRRDVLFGPFGATDTHNLANNFRRGFDGWLYGGQGVGNRTSVKGSDGHLVEMRGSTFRFRPDGTRIEKVGDGQANVFGLCFDPLGNLFTSDCHSMPIYQVIYGGFYPVFGKPHDGLGYAPQMLWHSHGSTAISGLTFCDDPLWPAEFQGNFLLGNVVTGRINRDRVEERGSTKIAVEMPDLVISRDPWFRPVDVQLGPDGALYIADFYNRIIAHVEVPLSHPGRDHNSGRIWRLVRQDAGGKPQLRSREPFLAQALSEQVRQLGDPSFSHRLAVLNYLVDRGGGEVIEAVRRASRKSQANVPLRSGALWVLERLGALKPSELAIAARYPDRTLRTHALRILVERGSLTKEERLLILAGLRDPDGFVRRAAADALSRHPEPGNIRPLLELRERAAEADTHLVYQVRKALRDQLLQPKAFEAVPIPALSAGQAAAIADVCIAIPSAEAAAYLAEFIHSHPVSAEQLPDWVRHIARHGTPSITDLLAGSLGQKSSLGLDLQASLFLAMLQGLEQRGMARGSNLNSWGAGLAQHLLENSQPPNPERLRQGAQIAATLQLRSLEAPLLRAAGSDTQDLSVRTAALKALLRLSPATHLSAAAAFIREASLPQDRRVEIMQAVAQINSPEARAALKEALRQAPHRFAVRIAEALCTSQDGGEVVIRAVEEGQAPAQLLAERGIRDRLLSNRPGDSNRIATLTATLSQDSGKLQAILDARRDHFLKSKPDVTTGAALFQTHCAVCHSVGNRGGNVGPQLDGIGYRGLERLCEDVLNPNRNVDRVFRYSILTLKSGDVLTGLFRREEGQQVVYVDGSGKEFTISKPEIAERRDSESSLMPENFSDLLKPDEFANLMAFLLSQRGKR